MLTKNIVVASALNDYEGLAQETSVQHLLALNARNSPLLRLPRELLGHIFVCVAEGQQLQSWMVLGQICSSLRDVLLSLRHLWADAMSYSWSNRRVRDELLERAGPDAPIPLVVPVSIEINGQPDASDAPQFAMKHLHRARVVKSFRDSFIAWFVQNENFPSLPHLEEVVLTNIGRGEQTAHEHSPRKTPRLKHVTLSWVHWCFSPSALTTLSIQHTSSNRVYTPSQFLDMLRESHRLQSLRLITCLPWIPDDMVSEGSVFLPSLRTAYIADLRMYTIQLWQSLSVPSDAQIQLEFGSDEQPHPLHPKYTGPSRFLDSAVFKRHLMGRRLVALNLTRGVDGSGFSVYSAHNFDQGDGVEGSQTTLKLVYVGYDAEGALHGVCSGLGLFDVPRLVVDGLVDGEDTQDWITMLSGFVHLEHLVVDQLTGPLCAALGSPSTRQSSIESNAPTLPHLLPRLRQLTVSNASMRTRAGRTSDGLSTAVFLNMMQLRSDQGQPLGAIDLENLTVNSSSEGPGVRLFLNALRSRFPECHVDSS